MSRAHAHLLRLLIVAVALGLHTPDAAARKIVKGSVVRTASNEDCLDCSGGMVFTAPADGQVLIRLRATAAFTIVPNGAPNNSGICVLDGLLPVEAWDSLTLTATTVAIDASPTGAWSFSRDGGTFVIYLTGLTPGSSQSMQISTQACGGSFPSVSHSLYWEVFANACGE